MKWTTLFQPRMQTHGPERTWGHAALLQLPCSCDTNDTLTSESMQKTRLLSQHREKHQHQSFHSLCCFYSTPAKTHNPSSPVYPCLTIQSEAGGDFLGVVAEPVVARVLPRSISLPHLCTLPRTPSRPAVLSLLPLADQSFRLLCGHMHACASTLTSAHTVCTHTKVLMQRVGLLEQEQPSLWPGWGVRLGYCRMKQSLLFQPLLIIWINCSVTGMMEDELLRQRVGQ